ncbi:hypothetical protein Dimus_026850, partial [Dionaea muscipula]
FNAKRKLADKKDESRKNDDDDDDQDGDDDGDHPAAPEKDAPSVNATEVIEDVDEDDDVVDSGGHGFDFVQDDDEQHDGRDDSEK